MRTVLVCAMALAVGFTPQKSPPKPPEHYAAIETWTEGMIVEIDKSGGILRLVAPDAFGNLGPATEVGGTTPATIVVELRYAKGWMYFDDPDGGPQERFVLREGREHLQIGHLIEIGRSNDYRGGVESRSIGASSSFVAVGGTYMKFEGWILIRVNEFLSERPPKRR